MNKAGAGLKGCRRGDLCKLCFYRGETVLACRPLQPAPEKNFGVWSNHCFYIPGLGCAHDAPELSDFEASSVPGESFKLKVNYAAR